MLFHLDEGTARMMMGETVDFLSVHRNRAVVDETRSKER